MGVSQLPSSQALTAGADLWVVSHPEKSAWALKIDWQLNFQILRAARHEKVRLSPEMTELLRQTGLESQEARPLSNALLVAADLNLPCRWVLSLEEWNPQEIKKVWQNLSSPSVRLFAPPTQELEALSQLPEIDQATVDFQVVSG